MINAVQLMLPAIRTQFSVIEGEEAGGSTRENSAVRSLTQTEESDVRQMQCFVDPLEPFTCLRTPEQSAIRSRPYFPTAIRHHCAHELIGQSLLGPEGLELTILIVQQSAAIGRHPQGAVPGHGERADIVVRHGGSIETRVDHEAYAVESSETARSTHPQVPIGCLGDRPNPIFRESVLGAPDLTHIGGRLRSGRWQD